MKTSPWICVMSCAAFSALALPAEKEEGLLNRLFGDQEAKAVTAEQVNLALSVRDYLGKDMVNAQGERLGKVVDLTLKDSHGYFEKAIVSVGGFLNIGEVLVAVPYANIQRKPGTPDLIWDVPMKDFQAMVHQAKENKKLGSSKETKAKDPDVIKVESALQQDEQLADKLANVQIHKENGKLVLKGKVETMDAKQRIVAKAKEHAACEVVDQLATLN